MNRRWGAALLALACLLPQAALAVHHHEHEAVEACGCGSREAFECSDADCGSKEHHHHERAHDPATCRVCTADVAPILEPVAVALSTSTEAFTPSERAVSEPAPLDLWRSGRGPPA